MAVRTYITETEFAKIDNPQSSTTYIVLDDNDPTLVKKVVFKTNNINNEGEVYIVQDEYPTPSGAISITANGENIDVKQYATANVNVPNPSTGTLNITENDDYDVTEYAGVSVNVPNPSTGTLNITENDDYDVTEYAGVSVNVPNPSAGTLNITSNDTYDVTNYASAQVNVPNPSTGTLVITSNDTFDVTNYASAQVNVPTGEKTTCKFKIGSNGNFTFNKLGDGKYYLKKNEGEWTEYTTSQTVSVVNGDVIELKSDLKTLPDNNGFDRLMTFSSSVSFEVEGDILGTLFGNILSKGGGYEMFKSCTGLTKVPSNMFANYTYIPERFCENMFRTCSSLTAAPELPATTLGSKCYGSMFVDCTSLIIVPTILPATTLNTYCYEYMFHGCRALTTTPILPATTLSNYCYQYMFQYCTSLNTAPELPAATLSNNCYYYMFNGCTSLNYIKCLATTFGSSSTTNWTNDVAATGMFVKDPDANWGTGNSGIPNGWTAKSNDEVKYLTFEVLDPSTTFTWTDTANNNSIEYSIDEGTTWTTLSSGSSTSALNTNDIVIFKGSNLLINDGIGKFSSSGQFNVRGNIMSLIYGDNFINQTTISNKQFKNLFKNCTGLVNAKNLVLPTSLANYCYQYMFEGCTSLTVAPELPATSLAQACYANMFQGCTSLTTAPELPATTLETACYATMFYGCTSLTTAPELPATTLAAYCYQGMLQGCTSLNYVKCLATDISASNCTTNWLQSVAATGTFIKVKNMTNWTTGASGIPSYWTVENYYDEDYFTFEALEPSMTFTWSGYNNNALEYSLDNGTTWTTLSSGSSTPTLNTNDKIMFRGSNLKVGSADNGIGRFSSTGQFNILGNIMSLIYGDNFVGKKVIPSANQFGLLFHECGNVVNTKDMVLPATSLTRYCYYAMFKGNPLLVTAPKLPATNLGDECYNSLFANCTSLTTAPELPATSLARYCYSNMFNGCTSLNYIKCLATTFEYNSTNSWVNNVAATGTFVKDANKTWSTGTSGIPSGWTVVNA